MKLSLQTSINWCKIIKTTFGRLLLLLALTGVSYASPGKAQSLLNKVVTISVDQSSLENTLRKLEDNAGITFIYSKNIIGTDHKISLKASQEKLGTVLDRFLIPNGISYEVINQRIVLSKYKKVEVVNLPLQIEPTGQARVIVKGTITDDKGEPLPGVSIKFKGTSIGTTADGDGNYAFETGPANGTLVFSFIGFVTQEIGIDQRTVINVKMLAEQTNLNEVVVVGYGTQKKVTLTGAVASVSSKEINTSTNANLQNMLAGKLPGLRVQQKTSEPGNYSNNFDIRGFGTPLVVIDGVISDVATFNRLGGEQIESVSVLKDASAAVYGLKAGNGVILVTTKKGANTNGKATIEYSTTFGLTHNVDMPSPISSLEWAEFQNEAAKYAFTPRSVPYSGAQLENFRINPGVDWYSQVIKDYVPQMTHNISASGSTGLNNAVNYFLSANYYDEDGMWKSGSLNYDRYNIRSNLSAKITSNLTASMNIGYIIDTKNSPYKDSWEQFKAIWTMKPIYTDVYANGNPLYPQNIENGYNPAVVSDSENGGGYRILKSKRLTGQASLNYSVPFIKGLDAKFMYNYTYNSGFNKNWSEQYQLYDYDAAKQSYQARTYNSPTSLNEYFSEETRNGYQASLNYATTIAQNHNLKTLLLFEQNKYINNSLWATRQFSLDAVDYLFAGNETGQQGSADKPTQNSNQGLVGRVNYDYRSKYLAEFSFRYDGSSKFAEGHRWGFFPSGSVGWRLSEEQFVKGSDALSFISDFKLRASYGKLGDDGSSAYQWASGFNYPSDLYLFGTSIVSGLQDRGLTNQNLTWYTLKTFNVGLDWSLWKGLFGGSVDYFQRNRTGLLATRSGSLPGVVGANYPQENLNSDQTKGWELLLSHNNKVGELSYGVSGNISFTRTKNIYVERARATNSYDNWRNNPNDRWNDLWWGMVYQGEFTSQDQIRNSLNEQGTFQNAFTGLGDHYHADVNGDGYVDDNDVRPLWTNGVPKVNFGFTLNGAYKGFDVNFHFQGALQSYVQYQELLKEPTAFGGGGALDIFLDRWRQDDQGNWIPGQYPRTRDSNSYGPNGATDGFWVNDASYLRLKSAELGYTLSSRLTSKIGVQRARIFVNGFNLLTVSGLKFVDPEHTSDTYGYLYPITQNYNIGLNVTF